MLRSLVAEVAVVLGIQAGCALNNFPIFFDSIDMCILLDESIKHTFSLHELLITLYQHLAPRVIQLHGTCSEPAQVWNSILAGCRFSSALTRALLKQEITK